MVKWSKFWQFWRVPVPRDAIRYKNLNLLPEDCTCPNILAISFFYQNLSCLRYEGLNKDLVSHTQQEKCCIWKISFLELSHLQQVTFWKKKIIAKTLQQIHPSNSRFRLLYQKNVLAQGLFKITKILTIEYAKIFHFMITPHLHIP